MRFPICILFLLLAVTAAGQLQQPFKDCKVEGSTTIYDLKANRWVYTDSADAMIASLPASTFKIINLLIALETGEIKDEHEVMEWPGKTDTSLYGHRPEIYHNMSVKKAFEVSAGWVFIELAKRIGKERYRHYLKLSGYGNGNLTEKETDFWNFGAFGISPRNQVEFLVKVYQGKSPFAKRNTAILKRVMVTERRGGGITRSKTGWTRVDGKDWGWWVGWIERKGSPYFFATRITKPRNSSNPRFGDCRKSITKAVLSLVE